MELVLVESPKKARKIWGILSNTYPNKQFSVLATFGHMIDLPHKSLAIDIANKFKPQFEVTNAKQLLLIMNTAEDAKHIFIGTDDDREGEAIGWHVYLKLKESYPNIPIKRIRFHEITKQAIIDTYENPGEFDTNMVEAQIARRLLDRIVGYKISPVLWDCIGSGLSAGRVQSCVLRILADRELEVIAFEAETYFIVQAKLQDGTTLTSNRFATQAEAEEFIKTIPTLVFNAKEQEEKEVKAPFPFNTSKLLQAAASKLKMNATKTMATAQNLFSDGCITYHRTDQQGLNPGYVILVRDYIEKLLGKKYLTVKPRIIPVTGAHEGIRPTDINTKSTQINCTQDEKALYNVIWHQTLQSNGAPAVVKDQIIWFSKEPGGEALLWAEGRKIIFDGHYKLAYTKPSFRELCLDAQPIVETSCIEKLTEQPRRWTEPKLIEYLEKTGIDRPSTYATIISTLLENNYVRRAGNELVCNNKGLLLCKFMRKWFSDLVQEQFTAEMETQLDSVCEEKTNRLKVLTKYWTWLEPQLAEAAKHWLRTTEECTACGKEVEIWFTENEPYLRCPECGEYYGLILTADCKARIFEEKPAKRICPECKSRRILTGNGKYGRFFRCQKCEKTFV